MSPTKEESMAREDAHLRIRLPHDVKAWLKEQAKKNIRTQSAEITIALREKMEAEEAAPKE